MKKKLGIAGIILLIVVGVFFIFKVVNENKFDNLSFNADCIYVYSIDDDKEIFSKNPEKKVYPASLTKMMTVYTAIGKIEDFDKKAPIDKKSYQKLVAQNASMAGFYGNEPTTFED
ncbi:MAG: D-alanyl-D-alanine carboxypeptidase, partial [Finegoldia magna]|nr:D-alanyl-D-alanine carboxypeptidase [Finegoldia magna]